MPLFWSEKRNDRLPAAQGVPLSDSGAAVRHSELCPTVRITALHLHGSDSERCINGNDDGRPVRAVGQVSVAPHEGGPAEVRLGAVSIPEDHRHKAIDMPTATSHLNGGTRRSLCWTHLHPDRSHQG